MLLGTMHHVNTAQATGLCHAVRASPGEVHTQIQSRAGAPRLQPGATVPRRRKGWLFRLVSPRPWPKVGLRLKRSPRPPPRPALLCVNY